MLYQSLTLNSIFKKTRNLADISCLMRHNCFKPVFLLLFAVCAMLPAVAQPEWTLDPFGKEKKPKQYEEKVLGSEKTATKKFTPVRKFIQNNVTHYNYYFNANNKVNEVLDRAKMSHKDDFTQLLTFFPYTLDNTAAQQVELDSVIYKSTAGILLHDLRNDWIDNLYFLIGKAYFFRKEFDSAALTFQFINYNLYPRKKNNDDTRIVGSRNLEKPQPFSIADKENRNFIQRTFTKAPSRNESLLWLARTFIEQKQFGEAAGLLNILQHDPNFPKRLHPELSTITAYWFFEQQVYDSSAVHLEAALPAAETKQDRARWEFLLGQLYEQSGQFTKASEFYKKASKHTTDPVLDIYSRLNNAKMYRESGGQDAMTESINRLLRMARRDRYESYRDIIYYSAGKLSAQLPDTASAIAHLLKGVSSSATNEGFKSRSFFLLGNMAYAQREYKKASTYYDSILIEDSLLLDPHDFNLTERNTTLKKLVTELMVVEREDSLQMIARMSPDERETFIKKVIRDEKKKAGIRETEPPKGGNTLITFSNSKDQPIDLFAAPTKGEWYFYNNQMKARGQNEFVSKWGNRDNVDNWRRIKAGALLPGADNKGMIPQHVKDSLMKAGAITDHNLTYEGMLENVPLTPELLESSNVKIAESIFNMARIFQFELEDHEQAINMYELYLERFPDRLRDGEVYLGMYYSYTKLGNERMADHYKKLLTQNFSQSSSALKLTNPEQLEPDTKDPVATQRYADIYSLFIEGRFDEALAAKKKADSTFGNHYWTPQLLYIEAVHYVKERQDSIAIATLENIALLYPQSPLQEKAVLMIDVLKRREAIETYLTNLEITRYESDHVIVPTDEKAVVPQAPAPGEIKPVAPAVPPVTIQGDPMAALPNTTDGVFTLDATQQHHVIMIMNKVDGTYQGEARNAFNRYNRQFFYNANLNIVREQLDGENALLITSVFEDANAALSYYDKVKKAAPSEVSWLPAGKYYFLVISEQNLNLLRDNKNLQAYRDLLNRFYENRF